jgi:rRNA-processing protein FCF1
MMLFEFSIDLERELTRIIGSYNIIVPSGIIKELELLSIKGKGEKRAKAKAGLKLIKNYDIFPVLEKFGDDSVIFTAKKTNGVVVTNDKELRKRLKLQSIPVIFLRAKKKLELE